MLVSVCLSVCLSRFPVALYAQPENLLYASSDPKSPDYNTIKVADFGLSKFVSENSQMKTTCGTVRGGGGHGGERVQCRVSLPCVHVFLLAPRHVDGVRLLV